MGATDDATAAVFARAGATCFPLSSAIGADEAKWGSPGFARTKAHLLRTLLRYGVTVFFADADVVILRDPLLYVARQLASGASLLFHTDGFGSWENALAAASAESEGLESPSWGFTPEMNTGLFVATPNATGLAQRWCDAVASDAAFANWKNDQQALNELLRKGATVPRPHTARSSVVKSAELLISTPAGASSTSEPPLLLGLLPAHLFPSGHVYFLQRALRDLPRAPYAVHLTFQNCDQSGKRHRMREAGLWMIDDADAAIAATATAKGTATATAGEHYAPTGGLLSFDLDVPPELSSPYAAQDRNLRTADAVVQRHFQLVNHQLLQLRTALAIALVLNRTVVLPRFVCGVETVTNFAHKGIRCLGSNGCRMALPYLCPADHVLRMHYWRGVMPQLPKLRIRYREFSLLQNVAKRHPALLQSTYTPSRAVHVKVTDAPARSCGAACPSEGYDASTQPRGPTPSSIASAAPPERTVTLPAREVTHEDLLSRLAPLARSAPLIHFASLRPDGLKLKLPKAMQPLFDDTIRHLGGGYCCVEPEKRGSFGHFWYDLLWDVPHTDRWGRVWTSEKPWVPTPGP